MALLLQRSSMVLFFFQVSFLLYTKKCYFYIAKNKMDYINVHKSVSLLDDDDHDADDADQEDCIA